MHDEGPTRELVTKLLDSMSDPTTQQPLQQGDAAGRCRRGRAVDAARAGDNGQETTGDGAAELARTAGAEASSTLNSALGGARTQGLGGAISDTANTLVQLIVAMVNILLLFLAS